VIYGIDGIDNATAQAFYVNTASPAVVVGKDGTILARQHWVDPFGLRAILDEQFRGSRLAKGAASQPVN
jgi:hypothetical protein